jgi:hypothetical protein
MSDQNAIEDLKKRLDKLDQLWPVIGRLRTVVGKLAGVPPNEITHWEDQDDAAPRVIRKTPALEPEAEGAVQQDCCAHFGQHLPHAPGKLQNFLVTVIDAASWDETGANWPVLSEFIVAASSHEGARNKAVDAAKAENESEPTSGNDGFVAVYAYNRADLETLLDEVAQTPPKP